MKAHATEEGKTAQDNFTRAMKTLFRTPKNAPQNEKDKASSKKSRKDRRPE